MEFYSPLGFYITIKVNDIFQRRKEKKKNRFVLFVFRLFWEESEIVRAGILTNGNIDAITAKRLIRRVYFYVLKDVDL